MTELKIKSIHTNDGQELGNDELYFTIDASPKSPTYAFNGGSFAVDWGAPFDGNAEVTLWEQDPGLFSDDKIDTKTITWANDPLNNGEFAINFTGNGANYDVWFDIVA